MSATEPAPSHNLASAADPAPAPDLEPSAIQPSDFVLPRNGDPNTSLESLQTPSPGDISAWQQYANEPQLLQARLCGEDRDDAHVRDQTRIRMVYRRDPNGNYMFVPSAHEETRLTSPAESASEHPTRVTNPPGVVRNGDNKKRRWITRISQVKDWFIWNLGYVSSGLLFRRNLPVLDGFGSEGSESEVYDDSSEGSRPLSRHLDPTFRPATEEILRELSDPARLQQLDERIQAERPPGP